MAPAVLVETAMPPSTMLLYLRMFEKFQLVLSCFKAFFVLQH